MKYLLLCATVLTALLASAAATSHAQPAPKPLYRDPVFDGAADPAVIWNPSTKTWWMFYTNRRANVPGLSGVAWVHGTKIGIAESIDAGVTWSYLGPAQIDLPANFGGKDATHWAPDVITAPDGTHHMFLTVVPGVFEDWSHPRDLVHLTSTDLRTWTYASTLELSADRVIDACVHRLPDGKAWRLWYNNERDLKSIYYADSSDLQTWTDRGKVASISARGEGPYVFPWKNRYWMLVDTWKGLSVYRSADLDAWTQQPTLLLDQPGKGADDGVNGGHPCVVVSGGRAFCFYFTHPGRAGTITPQDKDALELRRSSIQVVELFEKDGWLTCDRDAPTPIALTAPRTVADAVTYLAPIVTELQREWPRNRAINIVCHGHSVPAGYFKTPVVDTFNAYPALLHRALKERFPFAVINVIVTAIGGENSPKGAARFARDVLTHRPDIVCLDYSLNDRGVGLPAARVAWTTMIEQGQATGAKIILLTPTPDVRAKLDTPADSLNQHAAQVRQLARDYGTGLVDSLARFQAELQRGTRLEDLLSQSNHPNARGHQLVATALAEWFPPPPPTPNK